MGDNVMGITYYATDTTGAFKVDRFGSGAGGTNEYAGWTWLSFSANRSSSTYTDQGFVIPKSSAFNYVIRY